MGGVRRSGVLLHPTSLPGRYGIGDLGQSAYDLVDFLVEAHQALWQVLPLGPTGYGDSPYASFSSHAGNPLLIDLEQLLEYGDLQEDEVSDHPPFPPDAVAFGEVLAFKRRCLSQASQRFHRHATLERRHAYEHFCADKSRWLADYALFMALKDAHQGAMWNTWETELIERQPTALSRWHRTLKTQVEYQQYTQFVFFEQWSRLRTYANERSVRIIGDIPIFVALDSADTWSHPDIFELDALGQPTVVAGVPPDYFSPTGQRWGNPLYRWETIAASGYEWWVERVRSILELVDLLRIDHFRGFQDYWEIPASESTAVKGRWLPGPGYAFFAALRRSLGDTLPIIAEDLGIITAQVRALREHAGLPGMKVLHFAFSGDAEHEYLPHNYARNCVVYLGTHDNDTTIGWFHQLTPQEHDAVLRYLGCTPHEVVWRLIRAALGSVADTAIITLQDLLELDSESRMNTPGRSEGNWQWRYKRGALSHNLAHRLAEITDAFGRSPRRTDEILCDH